MWSVMQEKNYKWRIKYVDKLRWRILTAWDKLDQRIIDTTVRIFASVCLAKGRHFEHELSQ